MGAPIEGAEAAMGAPIEGEEEAGRGFASAPENNHHRHRHRHARKARVRALFVPFPVQGQINPMMHLAMAMASHDPELHITFITPYHYHNRLTKRARQQGRRRRSIAIAKPGQETEGRDRAEDQERAQAEDQGTRDQAEHQERVQAGQETRDQAEHQERAEADQEIRDQSEGQERAQADEETRDQAEDQERAEADQAEDAEREELARRGFSEEVMVHRNIGSVCADNGLPFDFNYEHMDLNSMVVLWEHCYVMSENIKKLHLHHGAGDDEDEAEDQDQDEDEAQDQDQDQAEDEDEDQDQDQDQEDDDADKADLEGTIASSSFMVVGLGCGWAIDTAIDLGIPVFHFSAQSATSLSLYLHIPQLISHGFFHPETSFGCEEELDEDGSTAESDRQLVAYIPGIPALPPCSFPVMMHAHDPSGVIVKTLETESGKLKLCKAILINTFEELEGGTCRALASEFEIPVFPVGPVHPMPTARTVLEAEDDEHGCIAWLDKKPKHSVVYISFGSLWTPTRDLIRGIADGIRSSKQSFLWALRPSSSTRDVHELLPPGFLEETDGLIVPWAPQINVLAHSSIGAFLTHCGWNSTLESMSTGVPMIPVPMMADQTTNCKLVVDIWKVGIRVKFALRSDGPVVDSDDICRAVKLLCHNPEGREVKARVEKLMVGIRRAGGSSSAHLRDFVRSWNE